VSTRVAAVLADRFHKPYTSRNGFIEAVVEGVMNAAKKQDEGVG
jgi:hypothetical protein